MNSFSMSNFLLNFSANLHHFVDLIFLLLDAWDKGENTVGLWSSFAHFAATQSGPKSIESPTGQMVVNPIPVPTPTTDSDPTPVPSTDSNPPSPPP